MPAEVVESTTPPADASKPKDAATGLPLSEQAQQLQEQLVHQKILPKEVSWEKTIWKGPIEYVTAHSPSIMSDLGKVAGKASEVAGGAVNFAGDAVKNVGNRGPGFLAKIGGEPWRSRVEKKTKVQVGEWLKAADLSAYQSAFETAEVDGTGLIALSEIWASNKLGFLEYVEKHLGVKVPGHALRFGVKLEELSAFLWQDDKDAAAAAKAGPEPVSPPAAAPSNAA